MARIEYIHLRLTGWALYKVQEQVGSLGWRKACAYLNVVVDGGHRDLGLMPEQGDAMVMDEAVQALRVVHQDLFDTIDCVYVKLPTYFERAPRDRQARHLRCSVSTLHDRLLRADRWLMGWLTDRDMRIKNASNRLTA